MLWQDNWHSDDLKLLFPHQITFAKDEFINIQGSLSNESMLDLFHLPFSNVANEEFMDFEQLLLDQPDSADSDSWSYPWGHAYSVSKAYAILKNEADPHDTFKWMWKSCCQKH